VDESKEDTPVVKNGHSEEQTLRALRRAESGTKAADICPEHGSRQATFDIWKKKYSEPRPERAARAQAVARGEREA
jgi:Transposase